MAKLRCQLLNVLADKRLIGARAEKNSVAQGFYFSPRRRTPTEHRHRLARPWIVSRKTEMPKRTPASVDVSFHSDIDCQHG